MLGTFGHIVRHNGVTGLYSGVGANQAWVHLEWDPGDPP